MKVVINTMEISRRICMTAFAGAVVAAPALIGKDNDAMKELLESSQNEKKGITLYLKGQSIGGLVTKMSGEFIELRNREFGRIVVRMDAIEAAAMS